MNWQDSAPAAYYSITVRRNCSLSPAGRVLFLFSIGIVSTGIALAWAAIGAWPVVPFAGAEVTALVLAFRQMAFHQDDFERITFEGDRLVVDAAARRRVQRFEFSRYWAQVILQCNAEGERCRLALRSHGRELELGRFINNEQRVALAQQLRARVRH